MKRIIILLLTLATFTIGSIAEGIDFSSMPDEGIRQIIEEGIAELNSRNAFDLVELGSGTYCVGIDIAPGKYILDQASDKSVIVSVFSSADAYTRFRRDNEWGARRTQVLIDREDENGEHPPIKTELFEGELIVIDLGKLKLSPLSP